jgi:hypothetical protein
MTVAGSPSRIKVQIPSPVDIEYIFADNQGRLFIKEEA